MRDLLADIDRLTADGRPVGRGVVTSVWGSAPRPEGSCLVADADGALAGSVSGGCVEGAVVLEIADAIARGTARHVSYGVSSERAWEVGLACGGTIRVLIEPRLRPELVAAVRGGAGAVLATLLDGEAVGPSLLVHEDGRMDGPLPAAGAAGRTAEVSGALREAIATAALDALRRQTSRTVKLAAAGGGSAVFLEVFARQPKLVIVGAAHVAAALVPLARALGYHTIVVDGRSAFLTPERFPDADELILAWPAEAFSRIGLDAVTYVCILSHDPKFDEPALDLALRSPAAYVGAIGSRKTQAERRARLGADGVTDAQLDRLHGPIGLDLGGRQPAETALAILAEMTAVRYGSDGRSLRATAPAG